MYSTEWGAYLRGEEKTIAPQQIYFHGIISILRRLLFGDPLYSGAVLSGVISQRVVVCLFVCVRGVKGLALSS